MILGVLTIVAVFLGGYLYGIRVGHKAGVRRGFDAGVDKGEKRAIAMLL